jgi:beta-galactosidase
LEGGSDLRNGITAGFRVLYQPGELKAIATGQDNLEETIVLTTTGKVSNLDLSAERNTIQASHQEIVYVTLSATDEENRLVPNATLPVEITLDGEGTLLAAGNGSPFIEGSIQDNEFNLHRGRGLIIIRSTGKAGNISLTVKSYKGLYDQINIKALE